MSLFHIIGRGWKCSAISRMKCSQSHPTWWNMGLGNSEPPLSKIYDSIYYILHTRSNLCPEKRSQTLFNSATMVKGVAGTVKVKISCFFTNSPMNSFWNSCITLGGRPTCPCDLFKSSLSARSRTFCTSIATWFGISASKGDLRLAFVVT